MQDSPVLSWKIAGLLLGLLVILATALVKPFGVSTQYVVTDAIVLHKAAPAAAESNEYLNKYGEKSDWGIGYGWMLVFGMFISRAVIWYVSAGSATVAIRARRWANVSEI
ncbi:hypothetical protein ACFL1J_06530 [Pseudomonadota bacterium]